MAGSESSGFQASTSTTSPHPVAGAAATDVLNAAYNLFRTPYEAYSGQMQAGFYPEQLAAFQGIRNLVGQTDPYYAAAAQLLNRAGGITDPMSTAMAAVNRNLAENNAQQMNQFKANAIQQGGFGGDRYGVGRAELARQQNLANAQNLADVAFRQRQQDQATAYNFGQLGLQQQQAQLQQLQALMGAGQQQQQAEQAALTGAYNQWLQQKAFPYNQLGYYAAINSGTAPILGSTTNTLGFGQSNTQQQQSSGSPVSQILGGLMAASSFMPFGGAGSDEREKTNIRPYGHDPETGLRTYSYDDKKDLEHSRRTGEPMPPKRVSVMAQDLEEIHPDRVHDAGGRKVIEHGRQYRADGGTTSNQAQNSGSIAGDFSALLNQSLPSDLTAGSALSGIAPVVTQGLEASFDPRVANQMLQNRWAPEVTGLMSKAASDGNDPFNLINPVMRADGGPVDFGGLEEYNKMWKQSPIGDVPYIEIPKIPRAVMDFPRAPDLGYVPALPGGHSGSGGGGGEGSDAGFGEQIKKLSESLKKKGSGKKQADAEATAAAPEAAPAPDAVSAPAAEAAPAESGFSFGNLFGGQDRFGFAGGGAPSGGVGSYQSLMGQVLGGPGVAPPDLTDEMLGINDLTKQDAIYKPRESLPSELLIQHYGEEVPSVVPGLMAMSGFGKGGYGAQGLALSMLAGQRAADAQGVRDQLAQKREQMLAQPRDPVGYFKKATGKINPWTGLPMLENTGVYYQPLYSKGGAVDEDRKGFQLGGYAHDAGQLPSYMTGPGSQTSPSTFAPGYNPSAFIQQRADGGRTGYARPTGADLYNYFIKLGANSKEAAMLTGMAQAESNFNPMATHDKGTGFGMWGHRKDRWRDMIRYTGEKYPNWMSQAKFALNELRTSPKTSLARESLRFAVSPVDITKAGMHFERPQGYTPQSPKSGHNWSGRLSNVTNFMRGNMGDTSRMYSSANTAPMFANAPVHNVVTRAVEPEVKRGLAMPKLAMPELRSPGLTLPRLVGDNPAHVHEPYGDVAMRMKGLGGAYGPFITENQDFMTDFGQTPYPRAQLEDTPYAQNIVGSPMGAYEDQPGSGPISDQFFERPVAEDAGASVEQKPVKTETARPQTERKESAGNGPFYGDWRDYEPWKSDPIGGFIDELSGDVPRSKTIGKPESSEGGFDIFKDMFRRGGRVHFDGGGFAEGLTSAELRPEDFSPEVTGAPKGFFLDEESAPRVVAEDRPAPRPAPRPAAPKKGLGLFEGATGPLGNGEMEPWRMALLAAGLGMMSSTRQNPLQAIGEGGLTGLKEYASAREIENERQAELAKLAAKENAAKASQEYLEKSVAGAQGRTAAPVSEGKEPVSADAQADALFNEITYLDERIAKAPDASSAARLKIIRDGKKAQLDYLVHKSEKARIAQKESPEGIISTETAKDLAKQEMEVSQLGKKSADTLDNLTTMKSLLESKHVYTGPQEVAGLRNLRRLGSEYAPEIVQKLSPLDISKEGVAKTGDLVARANTMVKDALGGSLGAGVSNADVRFLQNANVSLENTKEENQRIIDAAIRVAKLNKTIAAEANKYKQDHNGHLDANWPMYRDKVQEQFYAENTPDVVSGASSGTTSGKTKSGLNWSVK